MALRASLGADFSEFTTAIKSVEVQLRTTADHAKNAGRDLAKMVEGFSGSRIAREAELAAEAVTRIGGASKLTEAEQRKVNRIVEEALAKYRALGEQAPAHLQRLANETKQIGTATDSWSASIAKNAAGYLAGMASWDMARRAIGGTVDFLKESVAAAAEAQAAQTRLATAMRTNGIATEGNRKAFADLAAELQRTTVYEDDQIVALEAMATQLGVLPSQMEPAIKAAANLASGLGIDLEKAMTTIVKANNESFTAFQRLGISIDETRAKAEGLPYVLEQINAGMGGQAAAEVETYAGQMAQLANEWGNLKEQLGTLIISNGLFADSLRVVTEALRGVNASTLTWSNTLSVLIAMGTRGGLPAVIEEFRRLGQLPPPKLDPKNVTDGAMAMRQAFDQLNTSLDALSKKAKDQAAKDLEASGRAAKQAAEEFKKITAAIREIELGGRGGAGAVWEFGRVLDEAGDTAKTAKAWEDLAKTLYDIEVGAKGASIEVWKFGQVIDEAGETKQVVEDLGKAQEEAAKKAAKGWSVTADVLQEVSRAAEMAGHKTTAAVMSIGAAIAQAAPGGPWAMALAGGMAIFSTLSDKLFKTEGRKVNDLRDAYIAAAGGLAALNEKARQAGMTLDQLLKANTVKEYEAAIAALNAKLQQTAALQGELAGLQQQLADRQVMDWQRAQEIIEKYGGTLGNLGQQFTAAKQAANWKSIWDDWQTLIDMDADVGGMLVSMKDEISALVQESLRVGTEIPEQFRPLIEELIRTGQLLDENGEAITDIGQLKFGAPLVSEVDKIIAKIDELITALTQGLTGAFQTVGNTKFPPITIPYTYKPTNGLPGLGEEPEPQWGGSQALGGEYFVTRPTLFLAGEAGPEYASFSGAQGLDLRTPPAARPIEIHIHQVSTTQLDGRTVAENQAPYLVRIMPNELALAGL